MSHYLGRLSKDPNIDNVHRFRTNSRRVEALVSEFTPESGNQRKLLKQLARLRKKAGKARDLDVQIAYLKELKVPDRQNHRAELLRQLSDEQSRRAKKLTRNFDPERVEEIRKRLRRAKAETALDGTSPLKAAFERMPKPGPLPLNEKTLHACRIEAKRARYLAELAGDSPEAKSFIEVLKKAQDEIGQWHDVLKLQEKAEKLFGDVHDSALVAMLRNITRARFRRAANALLGALTAINELGKTATPAPKLKSASAPVSAETVAA